MEITRELFQQQDLLNQRSAIAKEGVARSLTRPEARPAVIGIFQMRNEVGGEAVKQRNLQQMLAAVEAAAAEGVNVLAFPELCLPGSFRPEHGSTEDGRRHFEALAEEPPGGEHIQPLQDAAAAAGMVLAFGFALRTSEGLFNAAGVIDADGRWVGQRKKNPVFPMPLEQLFCEPDPSQRSTVFETRYGRVGICICFDGEFPESIRQMRLDGAEILLWCRAGYTQTGHLGSSATFNYSGAYAHANGMWVACCNCVGPKASGSGSIYTPWGEPLVQLSPDREELGVSTVDLAMPTGWSLKRDRLYLHYNVSEQPA